MDECLDSNFSILPNSPSTIVCIRVQWNHPDLSGCAPRVGCWLGGCRKQGVGDELSGYWVDLGGAKWRYKSYQFCLRLKPVRQ